MSDEINNFETCVNCGKSLKEDELEFCEDCEDMILEDDFSYFPGENILKKYLYKVKSKIDFKKYSLSIFGLFGLMVYFISNIYFLENFYGNYYYELVFIYMWISIVLISMGLFGFVYLNINRSKASVLLIVIGFMIFLITGGFYSFYEDILVYMQYIGALIVFATGVIGFAN
ncbi:hypothetical protein KQY27_01670 [Methanobrevibacter sp. TMH8]|uniref:hypothetical protein n=1 Tax=Methanobrevibacter sp. TMH8 TaxID=2848611 RepID=UPI001CCEA833|nr:hypothetical protein [Methanobrevibacter sp. TMH8]MBZ9570255.1 hypothetical protein [Methanobrevibacter sp. TMH8]